MKFCLGVLASLLVSVSTYAGTCTLKLKTTRIFMDGSEQSIDSERLNRYQVQSWEDCYEIATREASNYEVGTVSQTVDEETGLVSLDSHYFWVRWTFGNFLSFKRGKVNAYTHMFSHDPENGDQRFNAIGERLKPTLR